MIKKIFVISFILFIYTGCSDCDSDYDLVGVTINDFRKISGIKIEQICDNMSDHPNYKAQPNNPNKYGQMQGFHIVNLSNKKFFDLQETIHTLFPVESYKEDKYEQCNDYYIYDFISQYNKSETAFPVKKITIDSTDPNHWCINIGGIDYQWDVTDTKYDISK